jgi:hypothetical protein
MVTGRADRDHLSVDNAGTQFTGCNWEFFWLPWLAISNNHVPSILELLFIGTFSSLARSIRKLTFPGG